MWTHCKIGVGLRSCARVRVRCIHELRYVWDDGAEVRTSSAETIKSVTFLANAEYGQTVPAFKTSFDPPIVVSASKKGWQRVPFPPPRVFQPLVELELVDSALPSRVLRYPMPGVVAVFTPVQLGCVFWAWFSVNLRWCILNDVILGVYMCNKQLDVSHFFALCLMVMAGSDLHTFCVQAMMAMSKHMDCEMLLQASMDMPRVQGEDAIEMMCAVNFKTLMPVTAMHALAFRVCSFITLTWNAGADPTMDGLVRERAPDMALLFYYGALRGVVIPASFSTHAPTYVAFRYLPQIVAMLQREHPRHTVFTQHDMSDYVNAVGVRAALYLAFVEKVAHIYAEASRTIEIRALLAGQQTDVVRVLEAFRDCNVFAICRQHLTVWERPFRLMQHLFDNFHLVVPNFKGLLHEFALLDVHMLCTIRAGYQKWSADVHFAHREFIGVRLPKIAVFVMCLSLSGVPPEVVEQMVATFQWDAFVDWGLCF